MSEIQTVKLVPKNGHAARAQRTKERIIRLATKRFLHDGYTNVHMEDLAYELGMGKSTIYRNFSSKDELLEAVLKTFQTRVTELTETACEDAQNWKDRATLITKIIADELQNVTASALNDIQRSRPDCYKRLSRYRQRIISEHIEAIVLEGQKSGEFRTDVEPFFVSAIVWSTIDNFTAIEFMKHQEFSISVAIERILSVVFRGMNTKYDDQISSMSAEA